MPHHIVTRFLLFLLPFAAFLNVSATPFPQKEEIDRPRPGLTTTLDHYTGVIPRHPSAVSSPAEPDFATGIANGRLIFQSFANANNWQIYYQDPGDAPQLVVGNQDLQSIQPRLDNSGSQFVYASIFNIDYELYRARVDSPYYPDRITLTDNSTDDVNADWSPDGKKLVFEAYRDGQPEIYVMNNDGSEQTRLTIHPDIDAMPAWSPDGTRIAFVSRRTGGYRIYTMNADGSGLKQLSTLPYSLHPTWSPDGSRIAFDADSDGDGWQELWLMNADGSNPHMLFRGGEETDAWAGSWSPDGRYLAFSYIHYLEYQGQWYWTKGSLIGWDSHNPEERIRLSEDDRAWYPDWGARDRTPPSALVHSLPTQSPAHFEVAWEGTDHSGVARYDVQVNAGDGWSNWLMNTAETSAVYEGTGGKTYSFRVRAYDFAGNVGAWSAASTSTTVETLPPSSTIHVLPTFSPEQFLVSWSGTDPGGSGIANYDIQYRTGATTAWTEWQVDTAETSANFSGEPGHTYYFRVRAVDRGGNQEAWPGPSNETQTTIYNARLSGLVHDNRGSAISGAAVTTEPAALDNFTTDVNGQYELFLGTEATTYSSSWSKNGYGSTPSTQFQRESRNEQQVVLPPADDALTNGNFESGLIAPWHGNFQLDSQVPHTGEQALYTAQPFTLAADEYVGEIGPIAPSFAVDGNGLVHAFWYGQDRFYYSNRNGAQGWSTPEPVSPPAIDPVNYDLAVGADNAVHIVWGHYSEQGHWQIFYRKRNPNGTWSALRHLEDTTSYLHNSLLRITDDGVIHIIWLAEGNRFYHTQQQQNGVWSSPHLIATGNPGVGVSLSEFVAELDNDGTLHLFYTHEELWRTSLAPGEEWSEPVPITAGLEGEPQTLSLVRDTAGNPHLTWAQVVYAWRPDKKIFYTYLGPGGSWSTPRNVAGDRNETPYPVVAAGDGAAYIVAYESFAIHDSGDLIFMERDAQGTWSEPVTVGHGYNPQLVVDGRDTLHLVWHDLDDNWKIYYRYRPANGSWSPRQTLSSTGGSFRPLLESDTNQGIHLFLHMVSTNSGLRYIGPARASSNSDSTVSQQVTIPSSMDAPTLSYYYRSGNTSQQNNTTFDVRLQSAGNEEVLLETPANAPNWTHRYLDLSPWQGQTVTVTFSLSQESNQPAAWLYLDDVSLGSAHANLWLEMESDVRAVKPGSELLYTLTYGNESVDADDVQVELTLPDGVTLLETSAPPDSTVPLQWHIGQLAAESGPHTMTVRVRVNDAIPGPTTLTASATISTSDPELEEDNNHAEVRTAAGWHTYLPELQR